MDEYAIFVGAGSFKLNKTSNRLLTADWQVAVGL
jgi:hypothetical protein